MLRNRILMIGCALLATVFLGTACSSDNPTAPGGGATDTTAPLVAGIDPTNAETEVAVGESITVIFNEAMDPATADGNVTLSSGAISTMSWSDSRTLVIDHADWSEGAQVTVTIGTGLTDTAGNNLAAAYTSSFYVVSSVLSVLETNPADNATDVNRSTNIQVLFSTEMNETSIQANVTITAQLTKMDIPYTIHSEHSAVTLMIGDDLPANTPIVVNMAAGLAANSGATLVAPYSFGFTTGMDVDTTPPTVVSTSPANGGTMAADAGVLQITFSEPMAPNSFDPSSWNFEFAVLITESDPELTWNADFTVVSVPLPSPLPAGLPIEIVFSELTDAAGNMMAAPWTYEVDVAGTPNYFPAFDGAQFTYAYMEEGGTIGNATPTWTDDGTTFVQLDAQTGGNIRLADYDDGFVTADGTYELYRIESNRVDWLGFRERNGGTLAPEVLFDTPMQILPLPLAAGTWTASGNVDIPGEGTLAATITGTVVMADLDTSDYFGESIFYKDTYRVARRLEARSEGTLTYVENDTTWYSPTLGLVEQHTYDEELGDNEWTREISIRLYEFMK